MSDFQCPYCREFALGTMPALEHEYIEPGKVRFVYINLPLSSVHRNAASAAEVSKSCIGQNRCCRAAHKATSAADATYAASAAEVALCAARQQRFWPMHDLLFRHQDQWAALASPREYLLALG